MDEQQSNKKYADMSPDEVYEKTKEASGKGVAAAAGAVKGVSEKMDEHDLSGSAKEMIQKTGQTTREIAGAATEEAVRTKEHLAAKADPSNLDDSA